MTLTHQHANECGIVICGHIHVAIIGNWWIILQQILDSVETSGLRAATSSICISVVGGSQDDVCRIRRAYSRPGTHAKWAATSVVRAEYPTLIQIYSCARQTADVRFHWYAHTKGVSHYGMPCAANVADWLQLLVYFNILKWRDRYDNLNTHDICGVNWREYPWPHFSGNFWWARSDYVRRLIHPDDARGICTFGDRYGAEAWIGTGDPVLYCCHESGIDHYKQPYPSSLYRL